MSDNYKIIRRTREAVRELKSEAWGQTKIAKHIGVSPSIIADLLILDEVAQDLRKPTIDKFKKFLDTRSAAQQYMKDEKEKQESKSPEYQDPGPPPFDGKKKDTSTGLLVELTELSVRFVKCGYRLDASLTMIHQPK